MSRRIASLLLALPLASAVAACGAAPPAPSAAVAVTPSAPATVAPATAAILPTVSPHPAPSPTPAPTPGASGNEGNVDGPGAPDFSVEPTTAQTIRVTLTAPDAKAWRIAVAGTGDRASDRWELTVETGDVAPVITTTEVANGVAADPAVQPTLETGAAKGRICSATLSVCLVASSLRLPADGTGTIVLALVRTDPASALQVSAATAAWAGDPFVLGPWTTTEPFPWDV
jgi:hypothetical protein